MVDREVSSTILTPSKDDWQLKCDNCQGLGMVGHASASCAGQLPRLVSGQLLVVFVSGQPLMVFISDQPQIVKKTTAYSFPL